jgi:hypothetical protein
MSAASIRDLVGEQIWHRYFKFTVIRNPCDKLISRFFWHQHAKRRTHRFAQRLTAFTKHFLVPATAAHKWKSGHELNAFDRGYSAEF